MADSERPPKSLIDRGSEWVQGTVEGALEALEALLPEPEPTLIPIPVRRPNVPVRGRRRRD